MGQTWDTPRQPPVDTGPDLHPPAARRPRRPRRLVENDEFLGFVRRIVRRAGARVADGDVESLPDLVRISLEVDQALQHAVDGLRAAGYSWDEIATRVGTSRQAAHKRWSR